MEHQLAELVLGLRRMGHEVTVIARTCVLPGDAGVHFHHVRGPRRPFALAYPWFMVAGSLAVRRRRRGVVQATGAIVLNRIDAVAIHYCHQVGPANPSRSTALFRWHVKLASMLKRLGERVCLRLNDPAAVVCVSEGVSEEIREHFPRLADRVVTIHNGVDTEAFAPSRRREEASSTRAALGFGEQQLVALFVGSEWERKGLEPAIRALATAPDWSLVVAGSGDEASYRALADGLGVGERVRFAGATSDVQRLYQMSNAFVLPSSYETFSLVTFEAAASGLPILATAVSGVRELLVDAHNGFLIDREPDLIGERLRRLAVDAALRQRLGDAARQSVLAFSWERMVREHHALYRRLCETSSPRRS
jgi:glycosyltransferase involved in cell wall biosynthesis